MKASAQILSESDKVWEYLSDLLSSSLTVLVRSHMKAHVPSAKTSKTAREMEIFAIAAVASTLLCEN